MISNERKSVTAEIAPSATLPSSFFHFSRLISALALVGRPCVRERLGDRDGALRKAARHLADVSRQIAEIAHDARRFGEARLRGQAADDVLLAQNAAERLLVAEPVLKRDRDGRAAEQMLHAVRRRLVGERLALEQHHVGAFDLARVCRRA